MCVSALCDVCTTTKLPNDALLRLYTCHYTAHDCIKKMNINEPHHTAATKVWLLTEPPCCTTLRASCALDSDTQVEAKWACARRLWRGKGWNTVELDLCCFLAAQNSFTLFLIASNIHWKSTLRLFSVQVELILTPALKVPCGAGLTNQSFVFP